MGMSTYERTISMEVEPDAVFGFISDPNNMPQYAPTVRKAEPLDDGRIRVEGSVNGHDYKAEGFFRVDAAQRRIDWGSEGDHHYHGWLKVHRGDVTPELSEVTMELTFHSGRPEGGEKILEEMERSLEAIFHHFVPA